MRRILKLTAVAALTLALAGCGGGALLGALIGLISVGDVIGDVENLFENDDDPADSRVYLDGQLLPVTPNASGELRLQDLPEGRHLLHVVAPGGFRGAVTIIDVQPNADVRLGNLQAEVGGRIRGTVTLDEGGSIRNAPRVLVYAIPGGAVTVRETTGVTAIPPAGTHYAAYTDGTGEFLLEGVAPGDYLITAAVAGFTTDAQLVQGLGQRQTVVADLQLSSAGGLPPGTVSGIISGEIGGGATQSLPGASLRAELDSAFQPTVPQAVIDRIESDSGWQLRESPWFAYDVLATLSDAGGTYTLGLPSGTPRIKCFKYGFRPAYQDIAIISDGSAQANFELINR